MVEQVFGTGSQTWLAQLCVTAAAVGAGPDIAVFAAAAGIAVGAFGVAAVVAAAVGA